MTNETNKNKGKITVITGCMFAGKTSKLIELNKRNKGIVYKPKKDKRYSETEIVSHNGDKAKAVLINGLGEIQAEELKKKRINNIYIDELQFFPIGEYKYLELLAERGINVIVAGLDYNYFTNQCFKLTSEVMLIAEEVEELFARCFEKDCQELAMRSMWKLDKLPQTDADYVGGAEKYKSVCLKHFRPIC